MRRLRRGTLTLRWRASTLVAALLGLSELNEFLSTLGGHIGYAVRPPFRRQGYATEILRLSLNLARARGIDPVLVTCDDDNIASAKVIEANGGKLQNIVEGEPGMPPKRRYWC